jgi:hypothetical protein
LLAIPFRIFRSPVEPGRHRLVVMTIIVGIVLLIDVAVRVLLALTLSTTVYLAVHREVTWAALGLGVLLLVMTKGRPREDSPGSTSPTDAFRC